MDIITITKENLEKEHICCAISNNKDCQVSAKKAWISQQLDAGLMFKKCDVRGKCFIEYIPAHEAWVPISAEGYTPFAPTPPEDTHLFAHFHTLLAQEEACLPPGIQV